MTVGHRNRPHLRPRALGSQATTAPTLGLSLGLPEREGAGRGGMGWGAPSDQPAGGIVSLPGQKRKSKGFPLEKMKIELREDKQMGGRLEVHPCRSGGWGAEEGALDRNRNPKTPFPKTAWPRGGMPRNLLVSSSHFPGG